LYVYKLYGQDFIKEFFINDHWRRLLEAEHKGNDRWFFYPLTIILGFFPWSLFVATAFVDLYKRLKTGLQPFEYFCIR
jgi:4-amino-4-deoxy-L-arabinose transferase-like glycosyltransferase